jgi:hypothetical protein
MITSLFSWSLILCSNGSFGICETPVRPLGLEAHYQSLKRCLAHLTAYTSEKNIKVQKKTLTLIGKNAQATT